MRFLMTPPSLSLQNGECPVAGRINSAGVEKCPQFREEAERAET
jgi:hypothetical protein